MKKRLLLLFVSLLVYFPTLVLAQDTKSKLPVSSDADRIGLEINVVGNKIFTENAPLGKKIEIFSVVGQKVDEWEIKKPSEEYILNVPKGYYILKISDTFRKVAIR